MKEFLTIHGTDHVEFYVGNAKQAAFYYRLAFGMKLVAYRGPETGHQESASYLLQQGKIRFVFTTPMAPEHEITEHIKLHGDGVKDVAFWVDDAESAYRETVGRGAKGVAEPTLLEDDHGKVRKASIATFGDTIHSFIERTNYEGVFLPGFAPMQDPGRGDRSAGLWYIDHIVGNVGWGQMNDWVKFYQEKLGFRVFIHFDDEDISTEYSALMSKVMASSNERIKIPINEPAKGKKRSQIEEYIDFYRGPGVQHIAMASDDIVASVTKLRNQGVEFLTVPSTYYAELADRVGKIDESIEDLADLGILVDRDNEGYMLQIFTKPVEDRPTLFFEVIQRKGSRSFGKGNFKALFEAIEREQALRGTL
jgi:4-hydroxyphenylpyruvate dioxygenase